MANKSPKNYFYLKMYLCADIVKVVDDKVKVTPEFIFLFRFKMYLIKIVIIIIKENVIDLKSHVCLFIKKLEQTELFYFFAFIIFNLL